MVSRRNLLSISAIILVILFMFQLSGVVKQTWNDYGINQYADETKTDLTSDSSFSLEKAENDSSKRYAVFIGKVQGSNLETTIKQWCSYTKRKLIEHDSLAELYINKTDPPEIVLINSDDINWNSDIPILDTMIKENINFIFCNLPSYDVIKNNTSLQNILGITDVRTASIKLAGIKLFEGFLLGGEETYDADKAGEEKYQDMDLDVPWYSVTSGTKTYMVGLLDKVKYKKIGNEYLPAIIWRNSIGKARIFAVNGDYLAGNTGIGILDAMMSELHQYEIYPVVNAQSIITLNYPVLAKENDSEMMKHYSSTSDDVFENIIWPGIVALSTKMKAKMTCIMNPQLDYEDNNEPDVDKLRIYFKLINEQKGEVGLSGIKKTNLSFQDKVKADYAFLHSNLPGYQYSSYYTEDNKVEEVMNHIDLPMLQNIRTILTDYNEHDAMVSYANQNVLIMKSTIDGFNHTYMQDLRVKSLETALGYSAITANMERVLYPEKEADEWQYLYNDFSKFTVTYWRNFQAFDQTTLSESDKRMREFLALDYSDSRSKNTVTLNIKNLQKEGWFILRTHDENIANIIGGTYQRIENNAFLILAQQATVHIQLEKTDNPYYYNTIKW